MEIESGAKKNITNRRFTIDSEKIGGKVVKSSPYLVTIKLDNGKVKTMIRSEFEKICKFVNKKDEKKEFIPVIDKDIEIKIKNSIFMYIKRHFPNEDITFCYNSNDISVLYDGRRCGKLKIGRMGAEISFKQIVPPPMLARYKIRSKNGVHTYRFIDISNNTITNMGIAINWLLLTGKEKEE